MSKQALGRLAATVGMAAALWAAPAGASKDGSAVPVGERCFWCASNCVYILGACIAYCPMSMEDATCIHQPCVGVDGNTYERTGNCIGGVS